MIGFLLPLYLTRDYIFLGGFLGVEVFSSMILSIFPFVVFFVLKGVFNYVYFSSFNFSLYCYLRVFLLLWFCFLVRDPLVFLVFFESCAFLIVFLILVYSKDLDKFSSCFFMFFLNLFGSIPFMYFCSSYISSLRFVCVVSSFLMGNFMGSVILFFFFSLILFMKLPLFLFHFWLTKAHVSARGPSSIILASLLLKVGSFGFLKFSVLFQNLYKFFRRFIFSFCILGSFFLFVVMVRFLDMKYFIACSSIFHIIFIFPFTFFPGVCRFLFITFIRVGHGLISLFLFYLVTLCYESVFNRSFELNKCIERGNSVITIFFIVFIFLNLGIPPFIRFFSEVLVCSSLWNFRFFGCVRFSITLLLSIFLAVLFCSKFLFGKKQNFFMDFFSSFIFLERASFFIFIFFFPLFFTYSFSLIKILFCDGKEEKSSSF